MPWCRACAWSYDPSFRAAGRSWARGTGTSSSSTRRRGRSRSPLSGRSRGAPEPGGRRLRLRLRCVLRHGPQANPGGGHVPDRGCGTTAGLLLRSCAPRSCAPALLPLRPPRRAPRRRLGGSECRGARLYLGTTRSHSSCVASASRALSTLPARTASRKASAACSMPRCRATGTQSPRRRTVGSPLWSMISARLRTCQLGVPSETSRISSAEPLTWFMTPSAEPEAGESVAGQLQHHVVQQAALGLGQPHRFCSMRIRSRGRSKHAAYPGAFRRLNPTARLTFRFSARCTSVRSSRGR